MDMEILAARYLMLGAWYQDLENLLWWQPEVPVIILL